MEKGRTAKKRREERGEENSEEKDNLWWGPWKGELGRRVEAKPSGGDGFCLSLTGSNRCAGPGHMCSRTLGSGLRRVLSLPSCGHETDSWGFQSPGQNGPHPVSPSLACCECVMGTEYWTGWGVSLAMGPQSQLVGTSCPSSCTWRKALRTAYTSKPTALGSNAVVSPIITATCRRETWPSS